MASVFISPVIIFSVPGVYYFRYWSVLEEEALKLLFEVLIFNYTNVDFYEFIVHHLQEDTISINHNWLNGTNIHIAWDFLVESVNQVRKNTKVSLWQVCFELIRKIVMWQTTYRGNTPHAI